MLKAIRLLFNKCLLGYCEWGEPLEGTMGPTNEGDGIRRWYKVTAKVCKNCGRMVENMDEIKNERIA
jgi:hypothetical protein